VAEVKKRGWATAANEAIVGVNGLVAPIFDHQGDYAGAIAIAGSVQQVAATPSPAQIAAVKSAASNISRKLGWRPR
jgi:DNA-binding IclR family transcriptional regulator